MKLLVTASEKFAYITPQELRKRLELLGWTCFVNNQGHTECNSPNGEASCTINSSMENYNRNWRKIRQDLRTRCGFPELAFIWQNPFKIPEGFDPYTMRFKKEEEDFPVVEEVYFNQLAKIGTDKIRVWVENEYKTPADIDYGSSIIMFDDGSLAKYSPNQEITIQYK